MDPSKRQRTTTTAAGGGEGDYLDWLVSDDEEEEEEEYAIANISDWNPAYITFTNEPLEDIAIFESDDKKGEEEIQHSTQGLYFDDSLRFSPSSSSSSAFTLEEIEDFASSFVIPADFIPDPETQPEQLSMEIETINKHHFYIVDCLANVNNRTTRLPYHRTAFPASFDSDTIIGILRSLSLNHNVRIDNPMAREAPITTGIFAEAFYKKLAKSVSFYDTDLNSVILLSGNREPGQNIMFKVKKNILIYIVEYAMLVYSLAHDAVFVVMAGGSFPMSKIVDSEFCSNMNRTTFLFGIDDITPLFQIGYHEEVNPKYSYNERQFTSVIFKPDNYSDIKDALGETSMNVIAMKMHILSSISFSKNEVQNHNPNIENGFWKYISDAANKNAFDRVINMDVKTPETVTYQLLTEWTTNINTHAEDVIEKVVNRLSKTREIGDLVILSHLLHGYRIDDVLYYGKNPQMRIFYKSQISVLKSDSDFAVRVDETRMKLTSSNLIVTMEDSRLDSFFFAIFKVHHQENPPTLPPKYTNDLVTFHSSNLNRRSYLPLSSHVKSISPIENQFMDFKIDFDEPMQMETHLVSQDRSCLYWNGVVFYGIHSFTYQTVYDILDCLYTTLHEHNKLYYKFNLPLRIANILFAISEFAKIPNIPLLAASRAQQVYRQPSLGYENETVTDFLNYIAYRFNPLSKNLADIYNYFNERHASRSVSENRIDIDYIHIVALQWFLLQNSDSNFRFAQSPVHGLLDTVITTPFPSISKENYSLFGGKRSEFLAINTLHENQWLGTSEPYNSFSPWSGLYAPEKIASVSDMIEERHKNLISFFNYNMDLTSNRSLQNISLLTPYEIYLRELTALVSRKQPIQSTSPSAFYFDPFSSSSSSSSLYSPSSSYTYQAETLSVIPSIIMDINMYGPVNTGDNPLTARNPTVHDLFAKTKVSTCPLLSVWDARSVRNPERSVANEGRLMERAKGMSLNYAALILILSTFNEFYPTTSIVEEVNGNNHITHRVIPSLSTMIVPDRSDFYTPVTGYCTLPISYFVKDIETAAKFRKFPLAHLYPLVATENGVRTVTNTRRLYHPPAVAEFNTPQEIARMQLEDLFTGSYSYFSSIKASLVQDSNFNILPVYTVPDTGKFTTAGCIYRELSAPTHLLVATSDIPRERKLSCLFGAIYIYSESIDALPENGTWRTDYNPSKLYPIAPYVWGQILDDTKGFTFSPDRQSIAERLPPPRTVRNWLIIDAREYGNFTRYVDYTTNPEEANVEFIPVNSKGSTKFSWNGKLFDMIGNYKVPIEYPPSPLADHGNQYYFPVNEQSVNLIHNFYKEKAAMWRLQATRDIKKGEKLKIFYEFGSLKFIDSVYFSPIHPLFIQPKMSDFSSYAQDLSFFTNSNYIPPPSTSSTYGDTQIYPYAIPQHLSDFYHLNAIYNTDSSRFAAEMILYAPYFSKCAENHENPYFRTYIYPIPDV